MKRFQLGPASTVLLALLLSALPAAALPDGIPDISGSWTGTIGGAVNGQIALTINTDGTFTGTIMTDLYGETPLNGTLTQVGRRIRGSLAVAGAAVPFAGRENWTATQMTWTFLVPGLGRVIVVMTPVTPTT